MPFGMAAGTQNAKKPAMPFGTAGMTKGKEATA